MATNKFFKYLQPTIVKVTDSEIAPENLRGKYLVNFNVVGIHYFDKYYIMGETESGQPYLILNEEADFGFELEGPEYNNSDNIIDIPRVYIDITDKFINNDSAFKDFIIAAISDNNVYVNGTDNFVNGVDYWINNTLANYLKREYNTGDDLVSIPNYLTEDLAISEFFEDFYDNDYSNLDYFKKKNDFLANDFTEEELRDFYKTFCSVILETTLIDDEKRSSGINPIYDTVLHYYANYKSDAASNALSLKLNSLYSNTSNTSKCSCNSSLNAFLNNNGSYDLSTTTCSDLYAAAMDTYLKQMLGDVQFYVDWFTIQFNEWDCEVNDLLIDKLQTLLNEFMDANFNISTNNSKIHSSLLCNVSTVTNTTGNSKVIENYKKVLDYVYNKFIVSNTNKIKVWGEAFGELLPLLQF